MADVFISYRRKPSAALAQLVQEKLKNHYSIDAYVDTTRTDSTRVQFPERLMQAIADTPVFICLLGEGTLDSEWVLKEIWQAYELKKRCIPVFQESYTPPANTDSAVEYLLRFDGVHVFDIKAVFVDEAVAQIAALCNPAAPPRLPLRGALIGAGALVLIALMALIVLPALNPPALTPTVATPNPTQTDDAPAVADSGTQTLEPSIAASDIPSATFTPAPTDTPTPDEVQREGTLQAVMRNLQTEQALLQATADRATAQALTATAAAWTDTPTPDDRATAAALLTATAAQMAIHQTATADAWTDTPTATPPFTSTRLPTDTPSVTPDPLQTARTFTGGNADWQALYPDGFQHSFEDGVPMVLVPAGCFMMGSSDGESDEQPVHEQCFDEPFWIDLTEVTQADFERLGGVQADPPDFPGDDRPVEDITWFEARDFCAARGARLPTEAEWEYAARGPAEWVYPWGNTWKTNNAVWNRGSSQGTANVGTLAAGRSWVGAFDLSGNVWEWTSSLYLPYESTEDREVDTGNRTDVQHALRGGSWDYSGTVNLRAAYRFGYYPVSWSNSFGFRCARST